MNKQLWGNFATTKGIWRLTLVLTIILMVCIAFLVGGGPTTKPVTIILVLVPFATYWLLLTALRLERKVSDRRMDAVAQAFFNNVT